MSGRRRDRCDNGCWAAAERWIYGRYVCIRCALEARDQGIDGENDGLDWKPGDELRAKREGTTE